jgi:branched-chain amino acid aminotransferase
LPCLEARQIGYDQNLWCLGDTVTEAGQMNFFYAYRNGEKTHLVTPALDGQILPGVTRMSVLQLARAHIDGSATIPGLPDKDKLVVDETTISLSELARLRDQGDLLEAFGTGTAAVVLPIKR